MNVHLPAPPRIQFVPTDPNPKEPGPQFDIATRVWLVPPFVQIRRGGLFIQEQSCKIVWREGTQEGTYQAKGPLSPAQPGIMHLLQGTQDGVVVHQSAATVIKPLAPMEARAVAGVLH